MSVYVPPAYTLTSSVFSHNGMKRDHNEDAYLVNADVNLYLVADGMGGHNSGEIASRLAVDTVGHFVSATLTDDEITWPYKYDHALSDIGNRLSVATRLANTRIWNQSKKNELYHGMGTTLVGACFSGNEAVVVNVGDSRCYRWRDGELWQLSTDHSLLNEQLKIRPMTQAEIDTFPHKNVILRALGIRETVEADIIPYTPERGDILLMCSDGLNDMVPDEIIEMIIGEHRRDAHLISKLLVKEANARGGNDNVTALLVFVN